MFLDAFQIRGGVLGLFSDTDAFNNLLFGSQDVPLPTKSGKIMSAEGSLGNGAVFACVELLASKYAQVPIQLVQDDAKTNKRRIVRNHPWARALGVSPNPEMDLVTFKKILITLKLLRGQMFCEKKQAGQYAYLWPLTSPTMLTQRDMSKPSRPLVYNYSYNTYIEHTDTPNQFTDRYSADDLLVMLDFTLNGVIGVSRVTLAREAIALGLSYEEYSARLMKNDAVPRGFLVSQSALGKETKESMREEMQSAQLGKNRGKIGILDALVDFKSTGLNNKDAEFLDSRVFQNQEICRWFNRIPPHMICDLSRSTNNNIEQQSLEFLTNCMDPLFAAQEAAYNNSLLDPDELDAGYHFVHDRNALLAADLDALAAASQKDLLSGVKTINEARKDRGLDPLANGDVTMFNLGYGPVGNGFMTTNEIRKQMGLTEIEGGDVIMGLKSQQPETPDAADPQDKNNPMGMQPPAPGAKNPAGPQPPVPPGQKPPAPPPANGRPPSTKGQIKRVFLPLFEDAMLRVVNKEAKKLDALLRRSHDEKEIHAIYFANASYAIQSLKPHIMAIRAIGMSGNGRGYLSDDEQESYLESMAFRHYFNPPQQLFDAAERAKQRAEQEIDELLEMIGDERI